MPKRVIALLGQPIYNEDGVAAEAITPGMLVNGTTSLIKYATAGGAAAPAFALERDEMGKDIDTPYAIGDTVKIGVFHKGQHVNALIAIGQNIAANARLEAAADGTLKVFAAGVILARALEAVDNSAGGAAARLRVEIM
jgi:hypothetical protein